VNAGLELAQQVASGLLPLPGRVVVPLGTGGTMAGIALGAAIAGLDTVVVGARVGPRIGANLIRVRSLIGRTRRLLRRYVGRGVPRVRGDRIAISHAAYAGAYGRPHPVAEHTAEQLALVHPLQLDATYSAKAFAVAMLLAENSPSPTLYWLTFDARWLRGAWAVPGATVHAGDPPPEETP
jgi:D-cysteine desulfhydrase